MSDRYIKAVLTVIALELLWIGARDFAPPAAAQASAQQAVAPTPVVIRAIDLVGRAENEPARVALPFYAVTTLKVDVDRALPVIGAAPFKVESDRPLLVEAAKAVPVQVLPQAPSRVPGE